MHLEERFDEVKLVQTEWMQCEFATCEVYALGTDIHCKLRDILDKTMITNSALQYDKSQSQSSSVKKNTMLNRKDEWTNMPRKQREKVNKTSNTLTSRPLMSDNAGFSA